MGTVIEDTNFLWSSAGGGSCTHVTRQCNMVAHSLANLVFSVDHDQFWLEEFSISVASFVSVDKAFV